MSAKLKRGKERKERREEERRQDLDTGFRVIGRLGNQIENNFIVRKFVIADTGRNKKVRKYNTETKLFNLKFKDAAEPENDDSGNL